MTAQDVRETVRREAAGVLAAVLALWAVLLGALVGIGMLITGTLKTAWPVDVEDEVSRGLAADRTPSMDGITHWWSTVGNTEVVITALVVAVVIVRLAVGRWREPLFLVACVAGQALVFVLATIFVARPRPDVPKLDPAPPTSSFPSGHAGATTALYIGCAVVVLHTVRRQWVRVTVALLCLVPPALVVFARLYRGMHHPTDVTLGVLNGLACVLIAWLVLLRTHPWSRRPD